MELIFGVWGSSFVTHGQGRTKTGDFFDFRRCHICGREERKPSNNKAWANAHCGCIEGFVSLTEWDEEQEVVAYRLRVDGDIDIIYPRNREGIFPTHQVSKEYFEAVARQRF